MTNDMENLEKTFERQAGAGKISKRKGILIMVAMTLVVVGVVGFFYWKATRNQVYTDKASISAPNIALSSTTSGELKALFVKEGDVVPADFAVAQIGDEMVKTATPGLVIQVKDNLGENFTPNEPVVTIIDPQDLRAVAQVDETNDLNNIAVGQPAVFTVDAFGSKKFYGIVDEVAPTSNDSGVVFNISDQREVKSFDVKIRFDENRYPELKNGMSAKVWISTK